MSIFTQTPKGAHTHMHPPTGLKWLTQMLTDTGVSAQWCAYSGTQMSTHLFADPYDICTLRPSVCCVFLPRGVYTAIQMHKDTPTCPGSSSFVDMHMCLGACA